VKIQRCLLASIAALFGLACGPDLPRVGVARPTPAPSALWIHNTAVLDVASGARVEGQDVVVEAGRITTVGPTGRIPAPSDAQRIPGEGTTLLPGLIDMHGHIDADSHATWERSFPDHENVLASYLYSGVTTVFDPHDASGDAFTRRDAIAEGTVLGPQVFTTGPLLTEPGGHPFALVEELAPGWIAWLVVPGMATAVDDPEAGREEVDALAEQGADAIKIVIDSIPLQAPKLGPEKARAIVSQAQKHGLRVVAHTGTTDDAITAGEAGVAAWMHGVYNERIPDDQIAILASYGIPMVATIEVFDRYGRAGRAPWDPIPLESETVPQPVLDAFYPTPEGFDVGSLDSWLEQAAKNAETRRDNIRRLHEAGVTILAGSDTQSGVFPGPGLHRELAQLAASGLTREEAIRAATLDAARFLTEEDDPDFGIVAVGKRADLLLVEGDPTQDLGDLQAIREVIVAGVPLERTPISTRP